MHIIHGMRYLTLLVSLLVSLLKIIAPIPAFAADVSQDPKAQAAQSAVAQTLTAAQALSMANVKTLDQKLLKDCQSVGIAGDEMRDFRLRPEVKVTRDQFFVTYRDSFGLENSQMASGLMFTDSHGLVHSRWNQTFKGLPVLGMSMMLREKEGFVTNAFGRVGSFVEGDPTPTLTEDQALDIALNDIGATTYAWEAKPNLYAPPKGQLAWSSKGYNGEEYKLVYRFLITASDPLQSYNIQIDAKTGAVVNRFETIAPFEPVWGSNVSASGKTFDKQSVNITADLGTDGLFRLQSQKQDGYGDIGLTANVGIIDDGNPSQQENANASVFSDSDGLFTDPEDAVGVSAKWGIERALSYFYTKFGYSGWDGHGAQKIFVYLQTLLEYPDAYFEPSDLTIVLNGAGDSPTVDIGVVGHEFTHGIAYMTSGFEGGKGESPKLDEAFADLFGVLIRAYAMGKPVEWRLRSDFLDDPLGAGKPRRYHGNYYKECGDSEPMTVENDFCYRHHNSTVLSHAFFLIANGGTDLSELPYSGIGVPKMSEIAFLTMISLHPSAGFKDARLMALSITESIYGKNSLEYATVKNAFYDVGIGAKPCKDCLVSPVPGSEEVMPWPVTHRAEVDPRTQSCQIGIKKYIFASGALKFDVEDGSLSIAGDKKYCVRTENMAPSLINVWYVRTKLAPAPLTVGGGILKGALAGLKKAFGIRGEDSNQQTTIPADNIGGEGWEDWSDLHSYFSKTMVPVLKAPNSGTAGSIRGLVTSSLLGPNVNPWPAKFVLEAVDQATAYRIQISETPFKTEGTPWDAPEGMQRTIHPPSYSTPGSDVEAPVVLKAGKKYYWRASATGPEEDLVSPFSDPTEFTTEIPKIGLLPGWSVSYHQPVLFRWKAVPNATKYQLIVYNKSDNACTTTPFWSGYTNNTEITVSQEGISGSASDKNGKCWQVTASGPENFLSEMGQYTIGPAKPILTSPPNGAQGIAYDPTTLFSWTCEWAPNGFVFHLYNETYSQLLKQELSAGTAGTSYNDAIELPGLSPNTGYHWVVDAKGSADAHTNTMPSDEASFKTKQGSPAQQQEEGCSPIASAPASVTPGLTGVDELDNVSDYVCYTQGTNKAYYKLQFQPITGATKYLVTVKWFGNGSTVFSHEYTAAEVANGSTPLIPLNPGFEYGWQVSAKNDCMSSYGPASPLRYYECVVCSGSCGGYPVAPH